MSELQTRVSNEVDKFCEEQDYEVTYSEIFNVFFNILKNYSGQLLKDEWEGVK